MHQNKAALSFLLAGLALSLAAGVFLATATPARAQCGSQASSCKNCHEVQGELPVNADGNGWHQSHAFGDFCYICHAGNNQAMDKAAAHEGMVAPLSDVQAACQQCHVADLTERAQVYAAALGVEVGSGGTAPAAGASVEGAPAAAAPVAAAPSTDACEGIVVDDPNLVDYTRRYEEIVLGKKPVNWGNLILIGMIGLLVVGGGGFVVTREKLINVKFGDTRKVDDEYPADVVEMLPRIAGLKTNTRKSLKNVLDHQKADKALDLLDTIIRKDEEQA